MKILIFGKGQLGQAYKEFFTNQNIDCEIAQDVDIRNKEQVANAVTASDAEIVINTAAKTNLDWCEMNKLECFDSNTLGADTIGGVCQELGKYLVHVSTGCIQASSLPEEAHKETDPPTPTSFYSWSKYWADEMLMLRHNRDNLKVLIVRPRQPVSSIASPRNAFTKMLTYNKFIDTPNSLTVVEDLLEVTKQLIEKNETGIFNVANPGVMSPYKVALLLKELVKPDLEVNIITKDELNAMTFATRIDSVLDTSKLESVGIKLKPADERLREILPVFKKNLEEHNDVLQSTIKETEYKLNLVK